MTEAQQIQRNRNNANLVKKTLAEKLKELPTNQVFTRKELIQYLSNKNLISGVKYGFLAQLARGKYIILPTLKEEN